MSLQIYNKIFSLKERLEEDWEQELRDLGIWEDTLDFYLTIEDNRKANTILAFIVLAYYAHSEYLDIRMDRTEAKGLVFKSLAGINWATVQEYTEVAIGIHPVANQVIEWFIDRQQDWRWGDIITKYEYHSRATIMAKKSYSAKEMADAGKMLAMAKTLRLEANQAHEDLRKEFVNLDTALKAEKRVKVTDRKEIQDYSRHEIWLAGMTRHRQVDPDKAFNMDSEVPDDDE